MLKSIVCPYCECNHTTDEEDVGEWLYNELKGFSTKECSHTFVCASCNREFEVCIQTEYKFSTHQMD